MNRSLTCYRESVHVVYEVYEAQDDHSEPFHAGYRPESFSRHPAPRVIADGAVAIRAGCHQLLRGVCGRESHFAVH